MKRDTWQKRSPFLRKKTCFLLGTSLHFWLFVVRYSFSKTEEKDICSKVMGSPKCEFIFFLPHIAGWRRVADFFHQFFFLLFWLWKNRNMPGGLWMENSRVQKENSNCQRENLIMSFKNIFSCRNRVKISHAKNLKCKDFLSFLTGLALI
jgi:hypothetical protein